MNNVHHPQLDDDRLMLLSWSTPVLAQFVMLIIMCMQRHWLYVLMLAPGLLGSALSLAHEFPASTSSNCIISMTIR